MSRAFVKDAEDDAGDGLPDRPISPHPNYVTARGLAMIDREIERLSADLSAAAPDDRATRNNLNRELRYWRARRATAEVIVPTGDNETVQFGSTVTIQRHDGRRQKWRLVGEDEADPAKGTLPYVAPLARALIGKTFGDVVKVGDGEAEIVAIG